MALKLAMNPITGQFDLVQNLTGYATEDYVNSHMSGGVKSFFFTKTASDVAGMYIATTIIPTGSIETITATAAEGETVIASFITDVATAEYRVTDGSRFFYFTAKTSNASKPQQLKGYIYTTDVNGSNPVLLRTSNLSSNLTDTDALYTTNVWGETLLIPVTMRIKFVVSVVKTGGGVDPTVTLSVADDTFSRLDVPVPVSDTSGLLNRDQTVPQTTVGTFTFPRVVADNGSTASIPAFKIVGVGNYSGSPDDPNEGVGIALVYNASGNRQFWIGDSDSGLGFRINGTGLSGWDYKGKTDQPVYIGANGQNVTVYGGAGSRTFIGPATDDGVSPVQLGASVKITDSGNVLIDNANGQSAIIINGGSGFFGGPSAFTATLDIANNGENNTALAVHGETLFGSGTFTDPAPGEAYDLKMGGSGVGSIATTGRIVTATGIGIGTIAPLRGFHQQYVTGGGGDAAGKFLVESISGSYGQFQIVNPADGEVTLVFGANCVVNSDGSISANVDNGNIWAFGLGSYSNPSTHFTIGNNSFGGVVFDLYPEGILRLPYYTTDGFVKFSSSNGTLSVDTNTYLTAEADTLDTVTGRGATTTNDVTVGALSCDNFTTSAHYTGFPNRTATTLSFVAGASGATRTLTISGTNWKFWINGVEYNVATTLTNKIDDVTGLYWFWITIVNGTPTLNSSVNAPGFDKCLVATVYWNTTTDAGIVSDERHWMGRDKLYHEYLHETVGARWYTGGTITPTNTTFSITQCEMYDEDIEHILAAATSCRILYHDGAASWKWDDNATTPYKLNGTAMRYNNGTALADVGTGEHLCMWIYATNHTTYPFMSVMGNAKDTTIASARLRTPPSLAAMPAAEMKLLFRLIFKQNVSSVTYMEAADYRTNPTLSTSFTPTDHSVLAKLDYASSGHTGFEPTITAGTSSQFLKGDKSLDSSVYLTTGYVDRGSVSSADFTQAGLTADGNYHDLDLSSIVPAGAKAVLLQIQHTNTSIGNSIIISPKGYATGSVGNRSYINTLVANLTIGLDVISRLDSNRITTYRFTTTGNTTNIVVKGWWI